MSTPLYQVDAFTDTPFRGNPAAVCVLGAAADPTWMQQVAAEMNLSETAFVHPEGEGYRLRWFTPVCEVELCGHATLAAAHVLWTSGRATGDVLRFASLSGELRAERADGRVVLDFPSTPAKRLDAHAGLAEALGQEPVRIARSRFDLLAELRSEDDVRSVVPDVTAIGALPARGLIVTSRASSDVDFVSRFFAPAVGVDEDPVTGSAHACLGPYWASRLGTRSLVGRQLSRRGGTVHVEVVEDRVRIGGDAVTVVRGELVAPPD